jgi:hypothetical protein
MDNYQDWTPEARTLWFTSLPETDHRPQTLGLQHGPQTSRLLVIKS